MLKKHWVLLTLLVILGLSSREVLGRFQSLLVGGTGTASPIVSRLAPDKVLDVYGAGRENGTPVKLWARHDGVNQQLSWQPNGQILVYGNMCLDATGGKGKDGDRIVIWSCHGGANQRWAATAAGEIRGINNKCIDVFNSGTANGTEIILWPCNGGLNQKWDNAGGSARPPPPPPPPSSASTPTPVPTPTPKPAGLPIYPGQSIQAVVNSNPAGTTFIIKAGTHYQQSVIPKSGNSFIGEPGNVLDGELVTQFAFNKGNPPYPADVVIKGLVITRYAPPAQLAAIMAGGHYANEGSVGWLIEGNEVYENTVSGIRIGNKTRVIGNRVHHNHCLNIGGAGDDSVVEGNEIAFGNYALRFDEGFEAGGTKFAVSANLTLRNNFVHDNSGPGLWLDENVNGALIEGNRVVDNWTEGIVVEISYRARVLNNTVTGNGWKDPKKRYTYLWNAGIAIHSSPDCEVAGNVLSNNNAGIVAIQQDRSVNAAPHGPHLVSNLHVHDNDVTQTTVPAAGALSTAAGLAKDFGDNTIFTGRNNRFVGNRYALGSNPRPFAWMNGSRTGTEWQSFGQDMEGIFNR